MIELEKKDFHKLIEPLEKVRINNFFALSVIKQHVNGKAYVDNKDDPKTFYVVHPYGESLLFGNWDNKDFNNAFKNYAFNTSREAESQIWLQTYPGDWDRVLSHLFGSLMIKSSENVNNKEDGIIELNTRVNFKFDPTKYLDFKSKMSFEGLKIIRTDKQMYYELIGAVVPSFYWDTAKDFYNNGVGFSLFYDGKIASTAFSAFIHGDILEIGIETLSEFRGKGFAKYTCSALIDYCIENKYEPVWSCKLENDSSYKLAQLLGFVPTIMIPFYKLNL